MSISPDFLIKHVRPYGLDAYEKMCGKDSSLKKWLLSQGVDESEADAAFNQWATLAMLDSGDSGNIETFIEYVNIISAIRSYVLYKVSASTVMFLNDDQLGQLSEKSGINANKSFNFYPTGGIAIAVTIFSNGDAPEAYTRVKGAKLAADGNGICVHFDSLLFQ